MTIYGSSHWCLGWQIGAELPVDSADADEENKAVDGKTLLYVFERGCVA
jgi:hypothetical protein